MLRRPEDPSLPMRSFGFSIVYLMALFAVLLVDAYLPIVIGPFIG
jgi:protoheme IX farnesyltransferase